MRFLAMERLVESCREAKNALKNTDICWKTYGLISCFALSSWITVNGIWSELPVIVLYAPEGWSLASYIVVIIQLGIVGPLLFTLGNWSCPRLFTEKFTIYILIVIGIASCALLALFWKETTTIAGSSHSTAFLILVFALSVVDCTSTVVFLTFMALYDPRYLTALYIGESFCGLLPGLAALIQGSPKVACNSSSTNSTNDHSDNGLLFGAGAYFIILLAMMLLCGLAFLGLNLLPFAKQEQKYGLTGHTSINSSTSDETEHETSFEDDDKLLDVPVASVNQPRAHISKRHIILFIMLALVSCFTFGIIPSLSPYAFEPYGSVAYHLVSSVGPIVTSFICFFIIWLKKRSFRSIFICFAAFVLCAMYLVLLASQSPTPWLYRSNFGTAIAVVVGILLSMLGTYIRLTISIVMREESKRALYWCGMSIQIGSFIGAFSIFPFVDILHYFHQKNPC